MNIRSALALLHSQTKSGRELLNESDKDTTLKRPFYRGLLAIREVNFRNKKTKKNGQFCYSVLFFISRSIFAIKLRL